MEPKPIRRISPNFEVSVGDDQIITIAHKSGAVHLIERQFADVLSSLSILAECFRAGKTGVWVGSASDIFRADLGLEPAFETGSDPDRQSVQLRSGARVWFSCEAWELSALVSGLAALRNEMAAEGETLNVTACDRLRDLSVGETFITAYDRLRDLSVGSRP